MNTGITLGWNIFNCKWPEISKHCPNDHLLVSGDFAVIGGLDMNIVISYQCWFLKAFFFSGNKLH